MNEHLLTTMTHAWLWVRYVVARYSPRGRILRKGSRLGRILLLAPKRSVHHSVFGQQFRTEAATTLKRCFHHISIYTNNIMGGGGWYYVPKVCNHWWSESCVTNGRCRRLGTGTSSTVVAVQIPFANSRFVVYGNLLILHVVLNPTIFSFVNTRLHF